MCQRFFFQSHKFYSHKFFNFFLFFSFFLKMFFRLVITVNLMGIFFLGNNHPKDCWDDTNKHNASKYTHTNTSTPRCKSECKGRKSQSHLWGHAGFTCNLTNLTESINFGQSSTFMMILIVFMHLFVKPAELVVVCTHDPREKRFVSSIMSSEDSHRVPGSWTYFDATANGKGSPPHPCWTIKVCRCDLVVFILLRCEDLGLV